MPNSAISFNTSGLATTTSPGLVGTGAQTFAGKKTLDGGALIAGDTSAAAIASGYIGQNLPFTNQSVAGGNNSWAANATPLATLTAGKWVLFGTATAGLTSTPQAIAISTSTTGGTGIISQCNITPNLNINAQMCMPVVYVTVPFGSTQPIYLHCYNASGTATGSISTGLAIRIA